MTREQIWKEDWFGTQRERVLELLERAESAEKSLTFDQLRAANIARCTPEVWGELNGLENWSANDWMTALVGEVGELANLLKKIRRGVDLTRGMTLTELHAKCVGELADVQCYLDLLGAKLKINLGEAVRAKFNEVSERVGSSVKL